MRSHTGRADPVVQRAPGRRTVLTAAIDLDTAPYSSRFSRLLVLSAEGMSTWTGRSAGGGAAACSGATGGGGATARGDVCLPAGEAAPQTQPLTVLRAAYERPAAESIVVEEIRLLAGGVPSPWRAGADGVRFAGGARLIVTDGDQLVVTGLRSGDVLEMRPRAVPEEHAEAAEQAGAALPRAARLHSEGDARIEELAGGLLRIRAGGEAAVSWRVTAGSGSGPSVAGTGSDPSVSSAGGVGSVSSVSSVSSAGGVDPAPSAVGAVRALVARHDGLLTAWMHRAPQVAPARQAMADLCWWVLGNNTLQLAGEEEPRAVVPSKLGYVGLWQWDAYFIALGLRHGDPELAREQMALALGRARPDGQLPDVVHDHGVLDSSEDLPPGDLENLRRLASPTLEGGPVPLTKPPLTALTLERLTAQLGAPLIEEHLEAVLASQRWWFEHSDPGATGWPAYLHPYSSGLDDSPVFDHNAIVPSPDLAAYLIGQDRLLATWLEQRGREAEAAQCRERAERLQGLLEERWDAERELFVLDGENSPVTTRSILGLIALLVPGLRADIRDSLIAQVTDPARFGGTWLLPTVARDDPDFSPERMWRGPIWVNTAWLVIQGLRVQGHEALADQVRDNVLDLVMHAGGPSEYFDPDRGRKARGATVLFGWSSALFLEMAVEAADASTGAGVCPTATATRSPR